jgi:dolichol-phosphate mannosyltransferase
MNTTASKASVSFIVPALNEEKRLEATVDTILTAAADTPPADYEIVLVNDGSTDRTGAIMEQLAGRHPKIRVVHNERNLGFGGAYQRGAAAASCEYVMVVAGDNAASASSICDTLKHLGEADIIIPYIANPEIRSLPRRIGSRGFVLLMNLLFGLHIPYYNGMIPRRHLLSLITLSTTSNAVHAEALVKLIKAGYSYVEVGVTHAPAADHHSAAVRPKNLVKVLKAVIHLYREVRRPGAIPISPRLEAAATAKKT